MEAVINRYETGISENNLRNWGMLEVLKELVQNVVYAGTILGNTVTIEHDGKYAYLSNTPSGFTKGKLLIGESEQADVAGAPGQYGEGMKVAMSVARRCNKDISVNTNGFHVRPELEGSALDSNVRVLVFYITDNEWNEGTRFVVECDVEELEAAKASFAVLNGVSEDLVKTDCILEEAVDSIFVNGVRIAEVNSLLSYNFTSPELMNRDRTSVDMAKVKLYVAKILSTVTDKALIQALLKSICEDDSLLESQAGIGYYGISTISLWKEAAKTVFGAKVAMGMGNEDDTKARYHKFRVLTNVPTTWKYFFEHYLDIKYTAELEEIQDRPKNIHRKPSASESNNLGWAKRLIKLYYGDYGTVKVSDTVVDDYGNELWGLCDHNTQTIWIKRALLSSKEQTFKTLLHEAVHLNTHARDNTEEFTRAWEHACWLILTRGKGDA